MRHILALAALSLLLCASCRTTPNVLTVNDKDTTSNYTTVIRSGTSFGFCAGYCSKTLVVNGKDVTFIESAGRGDTIQYPTKSRTSTITAKELDCLMASLDMDAFMKLDTIIGCPDCADGGAEWIEITRNGITRRVTFDFGATIKPIQQLVDRLRLLRNNLSQGNGNYIYQTWEWVRSSGGIAGVTITPATEGYHQRAIYRQDGSYEFYHNDSLVRATSYEITSEVIHGDRVNLISYGDGSMTDRMYLSSDTLSLYPHQCADCFEQTFVKATTVCE